VRPRGGHYYYVRPKSVVPEQINNMAVAGHDEQPGLGCHHCQLEQGERVRVADLISQVTDAALELMKTGPKTELKKLAVMIQSEQTADGGDNGRHWRGNLRPIIEAAVGCSIRRLSAVNKNANSVIA
jgi:hypothetical protein